MAVRRMLRTAFMQTTVELPPLSRLATISPASIDDEARTVDVTFSTGVAVKRYDWRRGEYFLEKLSLQPGHVRLERLNAGAPVLDTHSGWSLADQKGVVDDASVDGKAGKATLRLSKRPEVDGLWQDIRDKVVRNVSVGYEVHAFKETAGKDGALTTRTAIDWEPYEISFVPMPADINAQTRGGKAPEVRMHTAVVTTVDDELPVSTRSEELPIMKNEQTSDTIVQPNPADPGAPLVPASRAAAPAPEPTDTELARAAERKRVQGIALACRTASMPTEFFDKLINDGTSLEDAQGQVFAEMRKRGGTDRGGPQISGPTRSDPTLGDDPLVHVRAGILNALQHRVAPNLFKLEDVGRNYRGLTLMRTAELFLQASGVRTTGLNAAQIAGMALGLTRTTGGFHTTSDFSDLLGDVANKTLRRAYDEAPQTWRPITRTATTPDFKLVNRVQLGDAPDLLKVNEHGEFTRGTVGEGKEAYRLATYGRVFGITRQALINDDTDAFSRMPMNFGRKARVLENDLVWEQITSNPTMGDGNPLFSAAHNNVAVGADLSTITITALGIARAKLRNQTSIDGDLMNLASKYLLVPPSMETLADQFVSVIQAQQASNVNPFQGKFTVIAEPRLEAISASAWYLAASPDEIDILEILYLEGQEGPMVETRVGFDVDAVEIKCRLDVAAKAIDWRGLFLNEGVGAS